MVERAYPHQYLSSYAERTTVNVSLEDYRKAILTGALLVTIGVIVGALIVYLSIKK